MDHICTEADAGEKDGAHDSIVAKQNVVIYFIFVGTVYIVQIAVQSKPSITGVGEYGNQSDPKTNTTRPIPF
jgi:hypothetical protein